MKMPFYAILLQFHRFFDKRFKGDVLHGVLICFFDTQEFYVTEFLQFIVSKANYVLFNISIPTDESEPLRKICAPSLEILQKAFKTPRAFKVPGKN